MFYISKINYQVNESFSPLFLQIFNVKGVFEYYENYRGVNDI